MMSLKYWRASAVSSHNQRCLLVNLLIHTGWEPKNET